MYYSYMKKILLLLIVIMISVQAALCANTSDDKKSAYKLMVQSHKLQHDTAWRIIDNFRYDHQFTNYIKFRCQLFESDRQRLMNTIFTVSSGMHTDDKAISAFMIKYNNNEINSYKTIVQEYCKYNAFKFEKRDPQACSAERINLLFQTMP